LHFCSDSLHIFVQKESRVFKTTLMVANVRKVPLSTLGTIFSLKCPTARNNTHCLPNLSERKLPNLSERNKIKMGKKRQTHTYDREELFVTIMSTLLALNKCKDICFMHYNSPQTLTSHVVAVLSS